MITAIWIFVLALAALWGLSCWGLYGLLVLDQQWLGDLKPLLQRIPMSDWLDRFMPGWQAMAELSIDAMQMALGSLGAAAPVVVTVVGVVGVIALVLIGALMTLMVVLLRDHKPAPASA